jgi:protein-tyrosine phosphatase
MDGSMLKRNLKVIVHCNGGKGRSGLVVCCVRI